MSGKKNSVDILNSTPVPAVIAVAVLAVAAMLLPGSAAAQQPGQKTFASCSEATAALITALRNDDGPALMAIFGSDANDVLSSGDPVEDKNDRAQFVQEYRQMHRLVMEPDGTTTLYVGAENWPAPIPLAHKGSVWYFDTPAGRKEIVYRRVGKNEMAVIQVCGQLVAAQKEYYAQLRDGNSTHQYAEKFLSDPGKQNGLYWEASGSQTASPIGPLVAAAVSEGYSADPNRQPQPFDGYFFRILQGQSATPHGAAVNYMVNGKMTRGFAFVAYPAEYRSSGVMTFIVNQDGVVHEKDLGPDTAKIAGAMTRYAPDSSWRKSALSDQPVTASVSR